MMLVTEEHVIEAIETADTGTERRRGLRIRQERPVKVFEPTSGRFYGGKTADISATGLRIELPRSVLVRPGVELTIHVGVADGGSALANRRQMIPARVVWVDRRADLERCGLLTVGVEFVAGISARLRAA
jgi:hypothetical protein